MTYIYLERLIDLREEIGRVLREKGEESRECSFCMVWGNPSYQIHRRLHISSIRCRAEEIRDRGVDRSAGGEEKWRMGLGDGKD